LRFHEFENVIFVTEIQTDFPNHIGSYLKHTNYNSHNFQSEEHAKKIKEYLYKLMGSWERALMIAIKHYAEKHGFETIMMWASPEKQYLTQLQNPEKLRQVYEDIPKAMGMKKAKIENEEIRNAITKNWGTSGPIHADIEVWQSPTAYIKESKNQKKSHSLMEIVQWMQKSQ